MSKRKEREALISNIEKFIDSLVTHLPYSVERNPKGEGTRTFHVDTIIEYAEEIAKAAKALK
jgi:hypothetical protein